MKLFVFRLLLAFFTIPGIAVPPEIPIIIEEVRLDRSFLIYDDILNLIEAVEQEDLGERTPEEIDQISNFLCLLAEKGASDNDPIELAEIQKDSYELCCEIKTDLFRLPYLHDNLCSIHPAVHKYKAKFLPCKTWIGKQCKSMKKFTKKHKKAIIIGAVIAVAAIAATIAVVAIGASAASSAAAIAGATAPALIPGEGDSSKPNTSPADLEKIPKSISSTVDSHQLIQTIDNKTSEIKAALLEEIRADQLVMTEEDSNWLIGERARELGSLLTHELLDGVTSLLSPIPELLSQIKEAGSELLPKGLSHPESDEYMKDPLETFNQTAMSFHEKVDDLFGTDSADLYSPDTEKFEFSTGMPPLPGTLAGIFSENSALLAAGKVADRGGLTKAGRALMKHGYRENSPFPKPLGNPEQVNIHGERILTEILNHPRREIFIDKKGGIKIYAPDGKGAYFRKNGTFRGFIEKQYEEQIYH